LVPARTGMARKPLFYYDAVQLGAFESKQCASSISRKAQGK
jgi:hypothetical protein